MYTALCYFVIICWLVLGRVKPKGTSAWFSVKIRRLAHFWKYSPCWCMFVCLHVAIFRNGSLLELTGIMMIFEGWTPFFCVQLTITYSTVRTAKCVCIFLNTNVFWPDGDVLKSSKHVRASNTHTHTHTHIVVSTAVYVSADDSLTFMHRATSL